MNSQRTMPRMMTPPTNMTRNKKVNGGLAGLRENTMHFIQNKYNSYIFASIELV